MICKENSPIAFLIQKLNKETDLNLIYRFICDTPKLSSRNRIHCLLNFSSFHCRVTIGTIQKREREREYYRKESRTWSITGERKDTESKIRMFKGKRDERSQRGKVRQRQQNSPVSRCLVLSIYRFQRHINCCDFATSSNKCSLEKDTGGCQFHLVV